VGWVQGTFQPGEQQCTCFLFISEGWVLMREGGLELSIRNSACQRSTRGVHSAYQRLLWLGVFWNSALGGL
jgi:hypothetical protein